MGQVDKKENDGTAEAGRRAIIFRNTGGMPMFRKRIHRLQYSVVHGHPAICFGVYLGGGQHTREEYVRIDSWKQACVRPWK